MDRYGEIEDPRKFVYIDGKFWTVMSAMLQNSAEYAALPVLPLQIDEEYIRQLQPRKDCSYVTEELLSRKPITMFGSTTQRDRYFRHDGTHRLFGAYVYLHLHKVPAKWVPLEMWEQFILAKFVHNKTELPFGRGTQFERKLVIDTHGFSPHADPEGPGAHYERNFPHPDAVFSFDSLQRE